MALGLLHSRATGTEFIVCWLLTGLKPFVSVRPLERAQQQTHIEYRQTHTHTHTHTHSLKHCAHNLYPSHIMQFLNACMCTWRFECGSSDTRTKPVSPVLQRCSRHLFELASSFEAFHIAFCLSLSVSFMCHGMAAYCAPGYWEVRREQQNLCLDCSHFLDYTEPPRGSVSRHEDVCSQKF